MKTLLSLLFSVVLLQAGAQERFEGTIVYKMISDTKEPVVDDSELKVHFGKNAIRIGFGRNGYSPEDHYLLLDSGLIYETEASTKRYKRKILFAKGKKETLPATVKILSREISVVDLSEQGLTAFVTALRRGQVLIYPAKDLLYAVPEEYSSNIELSMIYNGRIVLGATLIDKPTHEYERRLDTMELRAVSITRREFPEGFFEVPKDYSPEADIAPIELQPTEIIVEEAVPPPPAVRIDPPILPVKTEKKGKKKTTRTKSPGK